MTECSKTPQCSPPKTAGYVANAEVELNADKLRVADVLWAGQVEPRFLEVLPALLAPRPAFFHKTKTVPQDLAVAVAVLRG